MEETTTTTTTTTTTKRDEFNNIFLIFQKTDIFDFA